MDLIEFLRQFRIGSFAVFDFAISYLGVMLFSGRLTKLVSKIRLHVSRSQWLWLVVPGSILIHLIIGLKTPLTKIILDPNNYYLEKFVILFMLFMGLKDTRIIKRETKNPD